MTGSRNSSSRGTPGPVSASHALEILLETRSFSRTLARLPGMSEAELVALLRTLIPPPAAGDCSPEPRRDQVPGGSPAVVTDAVLYTDGASRGNPGQAGAGFALCDRQGNLLQEGYRFLGEKTNNEAEYEALLAGLEMAAAAGCRRLEVRADSQLMIRQLTGRYKVKNRRLVPLVLRVKELAGRFDHVAFVHVPREENRLADRLANRAIDEAAS